MIDKSLLRDHKHKILCYSIIFCSNQKPNEIWIFLLDNNKCVAINSQLLSLSQVHMNFCNKLIPEKMYQKLWWCLFWKKTKLFVEIKFLAFLTSPLSPTTHTALSGLEITPRYGNTQKQEQQETRKFVQPT